MTRPKSDAEQRLLSAGRKLLEQKGMGGLSVRAVAKKAGLNQGLMSYHFGGKEAFVKRVLEETYEAFLRDLTLEVEGEADSLTALRAGLIKLGHFAATHRTMLKSLLLDIMMDNPPARQFARANVPRHVKVLLNLVRRCMAEGKLKKRPLLDAAPLVLGAVGAPLALAGLVEMVLPSLPFGLTPRLIQSRALSRRHLEARVDLALEALK